MRVLQVTSTRQRRGAEVFASQLDAALTHRGHSVTTVALDPSTRRGALDFDVQRHGRADPRGLAALVSRVRHHDVTISHGGSTLGPVAVAASIARRPFVYRNIGDPSFWGNVRGADLRIGRPLRAAAHVVALYQAAATYMVDRYRLEPRDVTVISNAVDERAFPRRDAATRSEARRGFDIGNDTRIVGYLGALSPEKRPEWALALAGSPSGPTVLLAGDGPLSDDLRRRRAALPDPDRARLLGAVSSPAEFLAGLDVLVLPSATEGIPGALLEAALTGVPVVATAVGGVPEVIDATGGGLVVGASDEAAFDAAVTRVLACPDEFVADREIVVARHGIEHLATRWENVLIGVVSDNTH